jgi:hypothetical protein
LIGSVNSILRMYFDSSILARALLDPLVGDLLVVEDHQFANRAVAAVQLIAELDHLLGDERRPRDRLDDRELAALDAPRDLDLALARQQGDGPHLPEVHPDGVVRLVERPRREVELELLGPFAGPVERLVFPEVFLVRVDDLDAGAAEGVEEIVELVRRGDFGRQQLVDLVVQEIALLLADGDQLTDLVVFFFNREMLAVAFGACRPRVVARAGPVAGGQVSSSIRWSRSFFRCHRRSISLPF